MSNYTFAQTADQGQEKYNYTTKVHFHDFCDLYFNLRLITYRSKLQYRTHLHSGYLTIRSCSWLHFWRLLSQKRQYSMITKTVHKCFRYVVVLTQARKTNLLFHFFLHIYCFWCFWSNSQYLTNQKPTLNCFTYYLDLWQIETRSEILVLMEVRRHHVETWSKSGVTTFAWYIIEV